MSEKIFTPLDVEGNRLSFKDSEVEYVTGYNPKRVIGAKGEVIINGKRYLVTGVECGLPGCDCDAMIRPIKFYVDCYTCGKLPGQYDTADAATAGLIKHEDDNEDEWGHLGSVESEVIGAKGDDDEPAR